MHTHTEPSYNLSICEGVCLCVSHSVVQYVWVWWSLHLDNGVENIMYVVSEVQDRVGDDSLGGGDAG